MVALSMVTTIGNAQSKAGKTDTTRHSAYYSCPKHPKVHSVKAGVCQQCGSKLMLSAKEQMKASVTKNYKCPTHLEVQSDSPGNCSKCGMRLQATPKEKMKMEVTKSFSCPMHPDVSSDKPGKCPKCGMQLTETKSNHKQ